MPRDSVTFQAIEGEAGLCDCCICHKNPATLKCSGIHNSPCCLQCAFTMLTELAERTVNNLKRAG